MNAVNQLQFGHHGPVRNRGARWCVVAALAFLVISTSACSGASGGGSSGGDSSGAPPPPPPPDGVITVTTTDVFGAPVPGAEISIWGNPSGTYWTLVADGNGRAEVEVYGVSSAQFQVRATATDLAGYSDTATHSTEDRLDFAVTLHPSAAVAGGITNLAVVRAADSLDGRSLEFKVRLLVVEGRAQDHLTWRAQGDGGWMSEGIVQVLPCEADCVHGPAGLDAPYEGSVLSPRWVPPTPRTAPLAISLLLDQGDSVIVEDPADRRLVAARYLQTRLDPDDQVVLAAFASDEVSSSQAALLPNQPVTIFPIEDPQFTVDGRSYFSTIDSLATLEGGASPLYAAVGELIDFAAQSAPADVERFIVALSSGDDRSCGSIEACGQVQAGLIKQGAASDVGIVAVGLADPGGQVDEKLALFAQGERGAAFWARDPTQIATILGQLPAILDGRHGAIDATIRLESTVAGAFATGNVVGGTIQAWMSTWSGREWSVEVPFVLRIP